MHEISRRTFFAAASAGLAGFAIGRAFADSPAPVRVITRGPRHHWFGYYDKQQFDPTDRYILSNEVSFEHRTPQADDTIGVGMVDTAQNDAWIELGTSSAWGWQQGCMLQWIPKTKSSVMWNDRDGDRFVCRIMDVQTKEQRTLPRPIYTLSPDGAFGLSVNFARLQVMRPGYGYVGLEDAFADERAPKDDGIYCVDLNTGKSRLILPLSEMAKIAHDGKPVDTMWHWFNHLLVSPDGGRFITLNRWRDRDPATGELSKNYTTRMITANVDGSDVFVLDPSGYTSHFVWRDPEHVCMWTRPAGRKDGFYLYRDRTREIVPVGENVMTRNGHNTYLPLGNYDWILNDTYPDKQRNQNVYLYHVPTGRRIELGGFLLPNTYTGEWRCDTHPRSSNNGRLVCIDSPHAEEGRQLHLIDIGAVLDTA